MVSRYYKSLIRLASLSNRVFINSNLIATQLARIQLELILIFFRIEYDQLASWIDSLIHLVIIVWYQ